MDTVANRIRLGMKLRNMKQSEIVEITGINKGSLSSYLSGKYAPKQNNTALIANALNVSEAWLMGYDVPIENNDLLSNNDDTLNALLHEKLLIDAYKDEDTRKRLLAYVEKLMDIKRMENDLKIK